MAFNPDSYSRDEDFDELRDKDEVVEVVGYVDEVHAPTTVGKTTKYELFKFMLNSNSNKRICCLIWGRSLIQKFVGDLAVGNIIHTEAAYSKAVVRTHYQKNNNLVPFELIVKTNTSITIFGNREQGGDNLQAQEDDANDLPPTPFANVGKSMGLIRVDGFVKMRFFQAENRYNGNTYGCGAITDGVYKVNIHVVDYTNIELEKGTGVRVIGTVDVSDSGPVTIVCRNDNSVFAIPDVTLPALEVARGVKTPKRAHQ